MRKLKSEDLPFVRKCNKLRAITGCMRACLKYFLKEFCRSGLLWTPVCCKKTADVVFFIL